MDAFFEANDIATPCSSLPQINATSFSVSLLYLAYISAGIYTPAKCPIWIGPFAYGKAAVIVKVSLLFFIKTINNYSKPIQDKILN